MWIYTKRYVRSEVKRLRRGLTYLDLGMLNYRQLEPWDTAIKELAKALFGKWEKAYKLEFHYLTQDTCKKHAALLKVLDYIEYHISTVGVPKQYTAPWTGVIITALIALLTGIFGIIGVKYSHYLSAEEKKQEQLQAAQATISSLRIWDQQDKDSFQHRFDSVRIDAAERMGIRSGAYFGVLEKLAQTHHNYRVAKIDSFMVRLSDLDVNTDTVNIDPRLHFRLGQYLKKAMLESLSYDQPRIENKIRELDRY